MEKTIFELSSPGRRGHIIPSLDLPEKGIEKLIPKEFLREDPPNLPEVSEVDVVRHFINLSTMNHHVDKAFYPLGSCTMKYSPKVNEEVIRYPGFSSLHPLQTEETIQGALRLLYEMSRYLCEISGMDEVTLQPAAGAHSEWTGMMMIRAYHTKKGNPRSKILIPDSAHGTNPASSTLCGYKTIQIQSNSKGLVDIAHLEKEMDSEVAALFLTNPNTLGLFESEILKISEIVHSKGGILYLDGANLNGLLGLVKAGETGFDLIHFNLHKTFSVPHGGGGPGGGGLGARRELVPFLPIPVIERKGGQYVFSIDRPNSIGPVHSFYGNFLATVRAYTYIRMLGAKGLRKVSENAVINANYLMRSLEPFYDLPYPQDCMHECVLSGDRQRKFGVRTLDIAKRLLDFGIHAPTIYFPLIVHEALMIEPTETESRESLDHFIEVMIQISKEAEMEPEILLSAPHNTPVRRLDEAKAAKELDVVYKR